MNLTQKNKALIPTQLLYLFQIYMPFLLPGYRFPESKQIRERKLQRKKNEDSLNKPMKAAKMTADKLTIRKENQLGEFLNLSNPNLFG